MHFRLPRLKYLVELALVCIFLAVELALAQRNASLVSDFDHFSLPTAATMTEAKAMKAATKLVLLTGATGGIGKAIALGCLKQPG